MANFRAGTDNLDKKEIKGKQHNAAAHDKFDSWKYPSTIGDHTEVDDISFNSHESSEYAYLRHVAVGDDGDFIDEETIEPFVLFEFMKINENKAVAKIKEGRAKIAGMLPENLIETNEELEKEELADLENRRLGEKLWDWAKQLHETAHRDYIGSIAMYMPTDIQINDTMVYNDDTRRIGGLIEGMANDDAELLNATVLTNSAVLGLASTALGLIPGVGAAISGVVGAGIGDILSTEVQRNSGKVMNPNELLAYQSTGLRSFAFNWTIMPDSLEESEQATGLIKKFRMAAHANRTSSTLVTVPDHVIVSFHGAKDMIQIPPCYIESVNVTYNPNVTSFFRHNNSPVEVGLAITLKEIIPIYTTDVERGY
jgi:hypothetical protein